MSVETALKILGLNTDFTETEFKTKYWQLAKNNHPDNNVNTENRMKEINEAKIVIQSLLKRRNLYILTNEFLEEITKIENKYLDTPISSFANSFKNKVQDINDIVDLNNIKEEFYQEIKRLKKEIVLPLEKDKLIKKVSKYLDNHTSEIIDLVNTYLETIKNATSLEELNTIKQKFIFNLKKNLLTEKKKIEEYNNIKESIKKSLVYYFYEYAKNETLNNIIKANNLLINVLNILNMTNQDNIYEIYDEIKMIDYDNLEMEEKRITKYLKDKFSITNKKTSVKHQENENILEFVKIILNNYYAYLTKKNNTIEKILNEKDIIIEIINKLNDMSLENINMALKYIENIPYKKIKFILDNIDSFYDPSKIYIDRSNGDICIILNDNKKVYTLYTDGRVLNNIKNIKDVFWQYISLYNFFRIADWSNGMQIEEVKNDDVMQINDFNANDLYFTKDLLLRAIIEDDNISFEFIPAIKGYDFKLSNSNQMTNIDKFDVFVNRDTCLMEFMLSLKKNKNLKNNEKNFNI